jgi:fibronectin-binding autotransporter adhesin
MRKSLLLLVLLLSPLFAAATTTLTGTASDNLSAPLTNGQLVFKLMNCAFAATQISTGFSAPSTTTVNLNSSGAIGASVTIAGNDDISCGSTSYYTVTAFKQNGQQAWKRNYTISGATWNVGSATILAVLPPVPVLLANPMTAQWDLIVGGVAGIPTRLALGANGTCLGVTTGTLGYVTCGSGGGGGGATLKTNGTNNPDQTIFNLQNGTGTTASNPSAGNVQVNVTYGTASGTAAQGNDSRITGALQAANNLSEVTNAATARSNIGLAAAVLNNQANTYTAGSKQTFSSNATNAGLNFAGVSVNPSSLASGDHWYRSDLGHLLFRDASTVHTLFNSDDNLSGAQVSGSIPGNAATATALAANGTNCSSSQFSQGIDASGNAEGCAQLSSSQLSDTGNIVKNNQANTYTAGNKQTFTSSASTAGVAFAGVASDPSSIAAGELWYRSDLGRVRVRDASTTHSLLYTDDSLAASQLTGTLASGQEPAHTGDVTNTAGSLTMTVVKVNGVSYSASPSVDTLPVISAANTASYTSIPNCGDASHAIGYSTTTHTWGCFAITGSAAAGGSNTQLQYNNSNGLSGAVNFTYNNATGVVTLNQNAAGNDTLYGKRASDATTTGTLMRFQNNGATTDLWTVDATGALTAGTVSTARLSGNFVSTFNSRTGAVSPASADYTAAQVTNAFDKTVANTLTNVAAPSSPSSGFVSVWADSTNLILSSKNSAGTISNTVVPSSAGANQFATAVSAAGVVSYGQPLWSGIGNPSGAQALTMGNNTSTWTWGSATGAATNLLSMTDGSGNTGTGFFINIAPASVNTSGLNVNMPTSSTGTPLRLQLNGSTKFSVDASGNETATSVTINGSSAGIAYLTQGTAQALGTTAVGIEAPTAVTSYNIVLPGVAATGIGHYSNASNTVTMSISAVDLASGDITGLLAGTNGGTGNAFFAVSGPSASLKTFAFPNASATVLTTNALVTVGQGGTGASSFNQDALIKGNVGSALSASNVKDNGTLFFPGENTDLQANAVGSEATTAAATYNVGDLACVTATNTVGSCGTAGANSAFIGVLLAKNGAIPYYAISGTASVNSSAAASFTQGDYVCTDASNAAKVVDNGTTACPSGQRQVGIVKTTDSSVSTHVVALNYSASAGSAGSLAGDVTGSIGANTVVKVNGVSYPASPSIDTTAIVTASNVATYVGITNCGDSTHALAYSTSTHTFSCQAITGSATAGGSTTQVQFNNGGALAGSANFVYAAASGITLAQGANNVDMFFGSRFTDTSSTGNFLRFQNAAKNADLFKVDVLGNLTAQSLTIGTTGTGALDLNDSAGTHKVTLSGPTSTMTANYTLTFPTTLAAGIFRTDGSGNVTLSAIVPGDIIAGVNSQNGAGYQVIPADMGKLVSVSNASAQNITMPVQIQPAGWWLDVQNTGAGTWTVVRNGFTIDGSTSNLPLLTGQGVRIYSDGSNWYTQRGIGGGGGGGGVNTGTVNTLAKYATTTTVGNSGITDDGTTVSTAEAISALSYTSTGTNAGAYLCTQGTTNGVGAVNTITMQCPTGVTAYNVTMPAAAASGIPHWSNSSNVVTVSISAIAGADFANQSANTVFAGPSTGAAAAPGFRSLVAADVFSGVNPQSGAGYTVTTGDQGKLVSFSNASAQTITLPGTPPSAGWWVDIQNTGAGTVTVSRNGLNIDGAATNLTLTTTQGVHLVSDGANYFTQRGVGGAAGAVSSVSGDGALITNSGSTGAVTLTLGTAAAHKYWGNPTGSTAAPGYNSIVNADLPGTGATTVNGNTCTLGSTCTVTLDQIGNPVASKTFTFAATNVLAITGTAPGSQAGAGTAAGTIFSISGITGGATTGSATTAGAGSSISLSAGPGGTGSGGTNAIGGAGGGFSFTAGSGGASGGTAINSNGGGYTFTVGSPGTGGSGTPGTMGTVLINQPISTVVTSSPFLTLQGTYQNSATPTFANDSWSLQGVIGAGTNGTSTLALTHSGSTGLAAVQVPQLNTLGTTAGFYQCTQGTDNGVGGANTITTQCPTAVTAYKVTLPGTAARGFRYYDGAATESFVGVLSSVATVTVAAAVTTDQNLQVITLPAGTLNVVGKTLIVTSSGTYTTGATGAGTMSYKIALCTVSGCATGTKVTLCTFGPSPTVAASATSIPWMQSCTISGATTGASGTVNYAGNYTGQEAGTSANATLPIDRLHAPTAASGAIDLTGQLFLQVIVTTGTGSVNNSISGRQTNVQFIN